MQIRLDAEKRLQRLKCTLNCVTSFWTSWLLFLTRMCCAVSYLACEILGRQTVAKKEG